MRPLSLPRRVAGPGLAALLLVLPVLLALLPAAPASAAVTFTNLGAALPGVYATGQPTAAWGDYDNDGDLDLVLTGHSTANIARVYRNDGAGVFTDIAAGLPGVFDGAVAWGDYDNDGDLDLVLTGYAGAQLIARLYRNDGADVFTLTAVELPGVQWSSAAWGDYDNDGDLDLVLTGNGADANPLTRLYRNDGGDVFTAVAAGLADLQNGAAAWGDYDNDGDLDLLLAGEEFGRVYRNDGGVFTDIAAGLPSAYRGAAAWGDYDADGDLDIVLAGSGGTHVYRNDGGAFVDAGAVLPALLTSSAAWGDDDNDGDLDLALAGRNAAGQPLSALYRNDGAGGFVATSAGLTPVKNACVAWGDQDNDGDLDLLLTGLTASVPSVSIVYRSDGAPANTAPAAPQNLASAIAGGRLTLSWSAASDAQTAAAGLSYNLRVGTTPGGNEIVAAASAADGRRRLAQRGNAQQRTSWTLALPPSWSTLYWSVQAVDGAFAGSPFAEEQTVTQPIAVGEQGTRELSFAVSGATPVAGRASFRFALPAAARVTLAIHDVAGRRVADLVDGELPAGEHRAVWARPDAPGVYFARLTANGREITRRIVVLR